MVYIFCYYSKSATKVHKKNDIHNSVCHFLSILFVLFVELLSQSIVFGFSALYDELTVLHEFMRCGFRENRFDYLVSVVYEEHTIQVVCVVSVGASLRYIFHQ